MMKHFVTLYRPLGTEELNLIAESQYKTFPPRLKDQPIFYPVLTLEYAIEIARDWNAQYNKDRQGYVTRFQVEKEFLQNYEVHTVGTKHHQEYWIPAKDLEKLNQSIQGNIEVVAEFFGGDTPTIEKGTREINH